MTSPEPPTWGEETLTTVLGLLLIGVLTLWCSGLFLPWLLTE